MTGGLLVFHANRVSGTYKLAIQCEGYKLASSPPFEWTMAGTGCGKPTDLGRLVVTADGRAGMQGQ